MSLEAERVEFWRRAKEYMSEGLITRDQVLLICNRPRKKAFVKRHIRDLEAFVEHQRKRREETTHDEGRGKEGGGD